MNKETEVKILKCTHMFHKKCIEDWFKRSPLCPYCRCDNSWSQVITSNNKLYTLKYHICKKTNTYINSHFSRFIIFAQIFHTLNFLALLLSLHLNLQLLKGAAWLLQLVQSFFVELETEFFPVTLSLILSQIQVFFKLLRVFIFYPKNIQIETLTPNTFSTVNPQPSLNTIS